MSPTTEFLIAHPLFNQNGNSTAVEQILEGWWLLVNPFRLFCNPWSTLVAVAPRSQQEKPRIGFLFKMNFSSKNKVFVCLLQIGILQMGSGVWPGDFHSKRMPVGTGAACLSASARKCIDCWSGAMSIHCTDENLNWRKR
jgi:hypothetical protein